MQTNNKLRAALGTLLNLAYEVQDANSEYGPKTSVPTQFVIDVAKSALAAPVKNCEVGTSDEQAERFENFCLEHIGCAEETGGRHCIGCPLEKASRHITQKCELYWAQLPYEEGETK